MLLNDKQRISLVRRMREKDRCVTILDKWNERKGRSDPYCYQVQIGTTIIFIGIVFGEILHYNDGVTLWNSGMSKNDPLSDPLRDDIDYLLLCRARSVLHDE